MASNAQILAAIVNKWAQPMMAPFLSSWVEGMPAVAAIQNKVRSMGWVSPNWSLMAELSPLVEGASGSLIAPIIAPIIAQYLSGLDDSSIPQMAHGIVDAALEKGELRLMDGKVIIERSDLDHLKRLLDNNLPIVAEEVITLRE
jgi:hypothetical protein